MQVRATGNVPHGIYGKVFNVIKEVKPDYINVFYLYYEIDVPEELKIYFNPENKFPPFLLKSECEIVES